MEGLLKKQEERIRVEMRQAREKERELDRCRRSVIIHNADRMAIEEENDYIKYTLAEQVTESLHTMYRSMICVMEAYTLGKWKDDKPPTSVCVVLGSARQKGIIFRTIAGNMRAKTSIGKRLGGVSIRDCFPKERIQDSQRLAQKGIMLKKNGQVEQFKVTAKGPGVIPVLEVRSRNEEGGLTDWEVYKNQYMEATENREVVDREKAATSGQERQLLTDPYLVDLNQAIQDEVIRNANKMV